MDVFLPYGGGESQRVNPQSNVQFLLKITKRSSYFWCMAIEAQVILKKEQQNTLSLTALTDTSFKSRYYEFLLWPGRPNTAGNFLTLFLKNRHTDIMFSTHPPPPQHVITTWVYVIWGNILRETKSYEE